MSQILLGTQGFSHNDWVGLFYPPGTQPADYLAYYSRIFPTVELDTTYYRIPTKELIRRWDAHTPATFVFSAKLFKGITHERILADCGELLSAFVGNMSLLGEKLGVLVVKLPPQFKVTEFEILRAFLKTLPSGFRFAVEVRDRKFLTDELFMLLRDHNVAFCMQDLYYMPRMAQVTAEFAYIRWMGRRADVKVFDRIQIDRTERMEKWGALIRQLPASVQQVYGYFNNHYAGHSPDSVRQMARLLSIELASDQGRVHEPAGRVTARPRDGQA
jgi:uncharacterized protein YecE (DUF72 family)